MHKSHFSDILCAQENFAVLSSFHFPKRTNFFDKNA